MQKFRLLALICAVALFHSIGFCDVIQLKSGRQLQCESVVEETAQVQCKIGRSTISFPKTQIIKIAKSGTSPTQTAPAAQPATATRHDPAEEIDRMTRAHRYTLEGLARMKSQQYAAAIDRFLEAYDLYRNKETITNLAIAYYYASNYDSAQSYFQEVLTIHPDDTLALNALGIISAIKGDVNGADNYWRLSYSIKADPVLIGYIQNLSQMRVATPNSTRSTLNTAEMENTISSYDEDSDTHFHIRYDGGSVNPVLLREISRTLEDTYDKLRFSFETEPANTLEVILYPKKDFLTITGAPDWSGGFNDGRIHLPVGGLDSVNADVTRVIVHELTHSFFLTKTHGNGPVWLQEGVAQFMDGTRIGTSKFLNAETVPSLSSMSSSFMNASTAQATVFYAASLSFVEFLMSRYRFDELNDFLRKLGSGETTQEGMRHAFGNDLSGLEEEWRRSL